MIRNDVGLGLGGAIAYTKFSFTFGDLTLGSTTQTITLLENPIPGGAVSVSSPANFQIPQGGAMLGVKIHPFTQFTGSAGQTNLTLSVGASGGTGTEFAAPFGIFGSPTNTNLQEGGMFKSTSAVSVPVTVTFVSTGAVVGSYNAGQVDIYLCYLNVTQSNIGTTLGVTSVALLPNQSGAGVGV